MAVKGRKAAIPRKGKARVKLKHQMIFYMMNLYEVQRRSALSLFS